MNCQYECYKTNKHTTQGLIISYKWNEKQSMTDEYICYVLIKSLSNESDAMFLIIW